MSGSRRTRWIVFPLLAVAFGLSQAAEPLTTVILVRHAEKQTDAGKDPSLTEAGRARAEELTRTLARVEVDAIFSSQFRRTRETVAPLAAARGLEVTVIQVADANRSSRELAERILSGRSGGTVVVAGHSNTVPMIIDALGAGPTPEIPESTYDDLFIVTVGPAGATSLRLKYGQPAN